MRGNCQPAGRGVYAVDTGHVRPLADASYLIVDAGRAAFVDTGTDLSVPNLLAALEAVQIDADAVDYIILTHIHLDHAGGAGRLAEALPRARIIVHPRGAAHLIDPSKLTAATKAVYGEANFAAQFGAVVPIAKERIVTVRDGERLNLGGRTFEFLDTPGHALHHLSLVDREAREVFTGDTFGVSYRELDTEAGAFIFPTTTPAQFDPEQLHASISRIEALKPEGAYLTHYGRVGAIGKLAADLHGDIDVLVGIAQRASSAKDRVREMRPRIFAHLSKRLIDHGWRGDEAARHAMLDGDVVLNSAGLDAWLARTQK